MESVFERVKSRLRMSGMATRMVRSDAETGQSQQPHENSGLVAMWRARSLGFSCGLLSIGETSCNDMIWRLWIIQVVGEWEPLFAKHSCGGFEKCIQRVMRRRRTRTAEAQRLTKVKPPAMVDT